MPCMVRPMGKAKKIAFKILGIPANMREYPTKKDTRIERQLLFEETTRVR